MVLVESNILGVLLFNFSPLCLISPNVIVSPNSFLLHSSVFFAVVLTLVWCLGEAGKWEDPGL